MFISIDFEFLELSLTLQGATFLLKVESLQ